MIGFGTFREGLQALTLSMSAGDRRLVESIAETGRLLEGGPAGPLEHFGLSEALLRDAAGMEDGVEFVGPLGHDQLARLPAGGRRGRCPSIFPETFGLVAAEFAASGVVPFVADHSGLGEAGAIIGRGLPFEVRVSMDGFEPGTHPDRVPGAPGRGTAAVRRSGAAQLHRASRLGDARAEDRARER